MSFEAKRLLEDQIWPRLWAGAEPLVGVCRQDAVFVVQWGVAGVPLLSCDEAAARDLADRLEAEGSAPSLADLLRFAAEVCELKNRKGAALQ